MMTLRNRKAALAVLAAMTVFGMGVVVRLNDARGQGPAAGAAGAEIRQKAQARVQAAENLLATLDKIAQAGEPLTPSFTELRAGAQRRLAEARIDAADDSTARLGAAQQYVQQCRDTVALLEKRRALDPSPINLAQAAYQLADAEYLLAKMQGK